MTKSPFIYGNTVSSHSFTNREESVEKLIKNLQNGINTTIISPRRWGKSSLVEKVVADIRNQNNEYKPLIIDLFSVSCQEEFLEIFAREVIKASSSKWQDWMQSGKEFFKNIIPSIQVGIDPATDFTVHFDWKEIQKNADEILNLPETIAQIKGIKMIVCFDEFQNLSSFPNFEIFEKKMRAVWQRQKLVTYCLYGSKRHMMTDIFNNPSKPFYRFGDIILLPKIEKTKWTSFIVSSFSNTGKTISEEDAELIPVLMKNHSWYVQQLAHYTWNLAKNQASKTDILNALTELIQANSPLYQKEVESISTTQLRLLKAVANAEIQFTSTAVMQKYNLGTPHNVQKNKKILINNDVIQDEDGIIQFVDPAYELWFKNVYFNKAYFNQSISQEFSE